MLWQHLGLEAPQRWAFLASSPVRAGHTQGKIARGSAGPHSSPRALRPDCRLQQALFSLIS